MDTNVTALSLPDVSSLIEKSRKLLLDDNGLFDKYPMEKILEVYNGVGPDRFPSWFRDMLSEINSIILPAVLIHDLDYDKGGNWDDFKKANERLGTNAIQCVKEKYGTCSWKYWFYLAKIHIFVKLCNKYGKPGWHFTGETSETC